MRRRMSLVDIACSGKAGIHLPFTQPFSLPDLTRNMPLLLSAGGILLIDMVLSGDNALVIGAAASRLSRGRRMLAITIGGLGAIIFRLILAVVATSLLLIPYVQAIGGIVLIFIAIRLLKPEDDAVDARSQEAKDRLLPAVLTILFADATMSLDNIIAVGALAKGNVPLLVIGVTVSMLFLFIASAVIARIIERFSWLIALAAGVLAWTAGSLFLEDPFVKTHAPMLLPWEHWIQIELVAFVLLIGGIWHVAHRARVRHRSTITTQSVAQATPDDAEAERAEVD